MIQCCSERGSIPQSTSNKNRDKTYSTSFYKEWVQQVDPRTKKKYQDYNDDTGLTVRGRRHNEVIGVIVGDGEPACHKLKKAEPREAEPGEAKPCEANYDRGEPGYDVTVKADADQLYFLSKPHYDKPLEVKARKAGILWLTVNDADKFRDDNLGLFFVKVTIR